MSGRGKKTCQTKGAKCLTSLGDSLITNTPLTNTVIIQLGEKIVVQMLANFHRPLL